MIQLLFTLSLNFIYLLFERLCFSQERIAISFMLCCLTFNFLKKFTNFFIFYGDNLFESIQLNTENLALILKVFFDILELEVNHFLKLLLESTNLLVLLFYRLGSLLFLILNNSSEPCNLFIFFPSDFFDSSSHNSFYCLFLMENLL